LREDGATVIFVAMDGKPAGILGIADPVKAMTPSALRALRDDGVKVVMLTGDNWTTARAVAKRLGIDKVEAEILPEDKSKIVTRLRDEGRVVAMAGDGVNDAPALAAADIGIAMGTGTDVAIESAGVTLLKGDLQGIVRGRRLSAATMHNIRENLFFAFIYNAAGVPIAAGVLYPFCGVLLSPILAAAAMALSSVSVILNSLRLRRVKVDEPTTANRFYSTVRNRKGTAWAATAALLAISIGAILIGYAPKFLTPRETGPNQVEKAAPLRPQQAAPTPPKEADSTAVKGAEPTTGREREGSVTTAAAATGEFFKKKLPNGVELNIPSSGIEANLLVFLENKAKPERVTWFDFDRLQFETGKTTPQVSSREQLQNIAYILAAYPSVKAIKVLNRMMELGRPVCVRVA
jgi:soluble P-type ATPase